MRRLLLAFLCTCLAPAIDAASPRAVEELVADALGTPPPGTLADYANAVGRATPRYESPAETARRLVAGAAATKQPADVTALQLHALATALLVSDTAADRVAGHRARFHGHRLIAAVRYNLFKRSLRLAELVAATYAEKDAVAAWRDLVRDAERTHHPSITALRAELRTYEASLKDLEEQCCPPDEAILKEPVWQPTKSL